MMQKEGYSIMAKVDEIKTTCGLCLIGCGVVVALSGGKVVEVKGDPDHPMTKGALCKIGKASLEHLYHPDRLKHPLKRAGKRGEGKWQRISWDEAIDITGEALGKIRADHGPEAVVMVQGSAKGYMDTHMVRLANAFGTPNVVCGGYVCHMPKEFAAEMTFGFFPAFDHQTPPATIVLWGINPAETFSSVMHQPILMARKKGIGLIVVDPLETEFAKVADPWLQVRPGSDLALALGMIHVVINEDLYDKTFVENWTVGFDKLKTHVKDYPPEKVAEITWIPAEQIKKAARLYATSGSAHIIWGNALDHNVNSFQNARALSILMAITGNLGVPGGEIETMGSGLRFKDPWRPETGLHGRYSSELELRDCLTQENRQNKVGGKGLNMLADYRYVIPQAVIKSILEGDPYPIRAAYVQGSNPLSSWCNVADTVKAFKKLDFLAVSEMFMTPTAALADVVFPVAGYLEVDAVVPPVLSPMVQVQRKVVQIGECRSNHETILALAKKLGLAADFWDSSDGFWNTVLAPTGITFSELKEMGRYIPGQQTHEYKKYEKNGFPTPSGKAELYSMDLEAQGLDPLPVYIEPPDTPFSSPDLLAKYPLLCTTRKLAPYRHSEGRQIPSLRNAHPDPVVIMHPETAFKLGIKEGDWVFIENKQGRIKQRASLSSGVDPRVVIADQAWWFPEKSEADLFDFMASNFNVLTSSEPPFSREMGSFNMRGIGCKVYKAK